MTEYTQHVTHTHILRHNTQHSYYYLRSGRRIHNKRAVSFPLPQHHSHIGGNFNIFVFFAVFFVVLFVCSSFFARKTPPPFSCLFLVRHPCPLLFGSSACGCSGGLDYKKLFINGVVVRFHLLSIRNKKFDSENTKPKLVLLSCIHFSVVSTSQFLSTASVVLFSQLCCGYIKISTLDSN
jgi:hypothetical protein